MKSIIVTLGVVIRDHLSGGHVTRSLGNRVTWVQDRTGQPSLEGNSLWKNGTDFSEKLDGN